MYSIHRTNDIKRLTSAAQTMLALIQSGVMLDDSDAAKALSTETADRLEQALEPVALACAASTQISPFIRYRSEIMGCSSTAEKLRELVLHLYDHTPTDIGQLLRGADKKHTGIVLEMICSYTRVGENDPHFMVLASDILERNRIEIAAEEVGA